MPNGVPNRRRLKAAPKRVVVQPRRYHRQYPIKGGHSYEVRSVPWPTWNACFLRAQLDEVGMRTVCIRLLEYYAAHGLPKGYEVEPPPDRPRRK